MKQTADTRVGRAFQSAIVSLPNGGSGVKHACLPGRCAAAPSHCLAVWRAGGTVHPPRSRGVTTRGGGSHRVLT